jgi:hypothetical protein
MINKTSRLFYLPVVAAGIPFALAATVTGSQLVTRTATLSEVSLPLFAMTGLSVAIFLLLGIPIALMAALENAAIQRLVNGEYWARWPQYQNDEDWRSFAERQHQEDRKGVHLPWPSVVVVTVVIGIAAIVPGASGAFAGMSMGSMVVVGAALGMFYLVFLALVVGSAVLKRRSVEATYRRRMSLSVPTVYIGKHGLYDEDKGYQEFGGLNTRLMDVQYMEGSPATLNFELLVRYSLGVDQSSRRMGLTVPVRVLAEYRDEAKALAERFKKESLFMK